MYRNEDIDYLKYLRGKQVIIFGAGVRGKRVFSSLSRSVEKVKIIAFCDNDENKWDTLLMKTEVISPEKLYKMINQEILIIICSKYERTIKEQLLSHGIYRYISASQIDFGGGEEYYDDAYFAWQQSMGEFGGKISARMFSPYIREDYTVVEFGSGGGYLLSNVVAKEKIGIEINDIARSVAERNGIKSVKSVGDVMDDYADIIISTHALEHVENPLGILKELYTKLKEGGIIVFYVPNESCDTEYTKSEINNHLYTWNCLTLGNLFKAAGYFVHAVWKVQEKWPENFTKIYGEISPELFEDICHVYGSAADANNCMIIAGK